MRNLKEVLQTLQKHKRNIQQQKPYKIKELYEVEMEFNLYTQH